ncbi:MAG: hypothetical protein ACHQWU_00150 [Gemmatimonadales bacterium]
MRYLALVFVSFGLALSSSAAQLPNTQRPLLRGDHVRLSAAGDSASIVGHVVRLDPEQVVLAPDDSASLPRDIPLSQITRLEVERDARARTISASVGALLGVAAGASYYYFGLCRQDESGCAQERRRADIATQYDRTYVTTGDVLAIGGMLAGGLLGYVLAPAPHWAVVAAPTFKRGGQGETHTALRIGLERTLLGR